MMQVVLDHLWQSTLFAAIAGILTLLLRGNSARIRYWLWFLASVKFLFPFSLLVSLGQSLGWRTAAPIAPPRFSFVVEEVFVPRAIHNAVSTIPAAGPSVVPAVLLALWACGVAVVAFLWWREWRPIRTALR